MTVKEFCGLRTNKRIKVKIQKGDCWENLQEYSLQDILDNDMFKSCKIVDWYTIQGLNVDAWGENGEYNEDEYNVFVVLCVR